MISYFLVCEVEEIDLPVKRNQAFIIKFFSKTRETFCDHLLREGKEKKRLELLTKVWMWVLEVTAWKVSHH